MERARTDRRNAQGGYALMLVMMMFAAATIMLALSLPRVAMQAQRVKEERLIYRGEQYTRAIELYFRKYNKYPESIDDLEETDNIRFLRKRYKDPLTGEDEWRIIRMGADGKFKDSLIYDRVEEEQEERNPYGIQPRTPIGGSNDVFERLQSGYSPPDGRFRGAARARQNQQVAPATQPGAAGGAPQVDPGYPQPGQPAPGAPTTAGGIAGQPGVPGQPGAPGQPVLGPPGTPQPQPGQPGYVPNPIGVQQQNAQNTLPVGNDAAAIIRQQLFGPNPRGNPFNRQQQAAAGAAGGPQASFEEGIAGVASKVEDWGVKTYNGQDFYNLWEFVYDYREDQRFGGQGGQEGIGTGPKRPGAQPVVPGQPGATGSPYLPPGTVTPGASTPGVPVPGQLPGAGTTPPVPGQPGQTVPPGQPGTTPTNPSPGYDDRPNLPTGYYPPTGPAPQ